MKETDSKQKGREQDYKDNSNDGMLERELDYLCLIISSFFLNDLVDGDNYLLAQPNPSLLWLYFTSRGLRNCMYLGMACRVAFNALFRVGNRGFTARNCFFVGLFSYTAVRNISWSLKSVRRSGGSRSASSMLGNWFTQGHAAGSWFLGAGNGEWYGFFGHNSPEETQVLPQMLLDQMKIWKRTDDPRSFPEREDGESKYPENNTDPTPPPKVEEIFETSSS